MSATQLASSSPLGGSIHSDVLSATPQTKSEIASLIDELKRRGRVSVTSKRYPDGRELYTKAIDVLLTSNNDDQSSKELAILYSNRSLCHLQMSQITESYSDATSATIRDPTYVKGFWRLGQACIACGELQKLEEGLDAYEEALALDTTNKALKKEVDKVKVLVTKERTKQKEKEEEKDADGDTKMTAVVEGKKDAPKNETKKNTPKPNDTTSSTTKGGEFTKSEHVRGYKVVDGKKTSYFHHEQTDEEKRLIGDITPKRIDPNMASVTTKTENTNSDTSAWNKAGTWEETNVTPWAISTLEETLKKKCIYQLPSSSPDPNGKVQLTKVSNLTESSKTTNSNHASVATVRGKKRYIYEFTFTIHWSYTSGDEDVNMNGTMILDGIDGTHVIGEGYDIAKFTVNENATATSRGDVKFLLERFVRNGGFRTVVEKALDDWVLMFRETY